MARNEGRGNGMNGYSDHVCRPVIIDQYGRKQPIINFSTPGHNTDGYVTKKETIVEHVYTPMVTEYRYSPSSVEDEPYKDYGINNGRPMTYVHTPTTILHTPVATEYKYSSPAKVDPYKDYGVSHDKWRRPSSPVYDRPAEVEEFITKVQTEVSQPTRTTPFSGSNWRNAGNSTQPTRYSGEYRNSSNNEEKTGGNYPRIEPVTTVGAFARPRDRPLTAPTNKMGEAGGFLKEAIAMSSPLATTTAPLPQPRFTQPTRYGGEYRNFNNDYPRSEPVTTVGAFARPTDRPLTAPTNNMGEAVGFLKEAIAMSSPLATTTAPLPQPRFTQPTRYGGEYRNFNNNEEKTGGNYPRTEPVTTVGAFARPTDRPLTAPTNNMGEAVGFLKEAIAMSSPFTTTTTPPPQFIEKPVSAFPKRESYTETIDSREAARRYARPIKTEESYSGTIDSTEALRKYGGTFVP